MRKLYVCSFFRIIKKVIENFAKDPRCEVHQTLLGIREGKEGWFENFCPGNISCDDDGELFSIMVRKTYSIILRINYKVWSKLIIISYNKSS